MQKISFTHKAINFGSAFAKGGTHQLKQNIPILPAKKLPLKVGERY
jgi:hypothetical protein